MRQNTFPCRLVWWVSRPAALQPSGMGFMRICRKCKAELADWLFFPDFWRSKKGKRYLCKDSYCKSCRSLLHAARCKSMRNKLDGIKLTRGCERCGWRGSPVALDFHHKEEKTYTIAAITGCSLVVILAEIAKCTVLCANCHRIVHHADRLAR